MLQPPKKPLKRKPVKKEAEPVTIGALEIFAQFLDKAEMAKVKVFFKDFHKPFSATDEIKNLQIIAKKFVYLQGLMARGVSKSPPAYFAAEAELNATLWLLKKWLASL
jgi:hypothetical protein